MTSLLMRPLLQPLESAFGEYAGIAEQEFSAALSRVPERSHE
ncbi:MAG TPA: hypothetical protein VGZ02_17790 [Candidatus Baltobacteraceae bacterium]|nr:hypothetical protein [Candidatus Baltobacteraceae bacterium]